MIPVAIEIVRKADILLIAGTSLVVYPAAGLMHYAPPLIPKYYVDPKAFEIGGIENLTVITEKAGNAMPPLAESLLKIAKPN
jgi:NAD-dependent deacetylase